MRQLEQETIIRVMDMPSKVHGICYHDDDGQAYVVLNARDCAEIQKATLLHELEHIRRGDLENPRYKEY